MSLSNRFDKNAAVISVTNAENATTGSMSESDVEVIASYDYMIYPPSPRTAELMRQEFGLNPEAAMEFGVGAYDAALVKGTYLKDATNQKRYFVLGVRPQRGMTSEAESHHAHFVLREVPYV